MIYAIKAKTGSASVVRWLVEHGADPHLRDLKGRNAIHFAKEHDPCESLVNYLTSLGLDDIRIETTEAK